MDPKFPSPHSPIFLPVKPFFFDTTQSTSRKPAIPSIPHSYHRPKHISTGYHESCSKHGRSDQLKGRGRGAGAGAHRRVWTRQSRVGRPSAFFSRMSSSANEDARCKPVGESLATTGRLAVDPTPCPCRTPPLNLPYHMARRPPRASFGWSTDSSDEGPPPDARQRAPPPNAQCHHARRHRRLHSMCHLHTASAARRPRSRDPVMRRPFCPARLTSLRASVPTQ